MADVFISHVEEDAGIALALAEGLEAAGYATWHYERDSFPGPPYLVQVGRAIEGSRAVLIVVSPHALGSNQVTGEVVRAYECGKPFIPILTGISHSEFQARQPLWRQAMGAATSLRLAGGAQDAGAVLGRIIAGLNALGIEPGGAPAVSPGAEGQAPAPQPSAAAPEPPEPDRPPAAGAGPRAEEARPAAAAPAPPVAAPTKTPKSCLEPDGFLRLIAEKGPWTAAKQVRAARARQQPGSAQSKTAESLLAFLDDRALFLDAFPQALAEQALNELAPVLPGSHKERSQAAARQLVAREMWFRRVSADAPISRRCHSNSVADIALSADQSLAATASHDGTVCLWSLNSKECLRRLDEPAKKVALSPDGKRLWTASAESVRQWDAQTGDLLMKLDVSVASWCAFSFDASLGMALCQGGALRTFSLADGRALGEIQIPHGRRVATAAASLDGRRLYALCEEAAGSKGARIYMIDPVERTLLREVPVPDGHKVQSLGTDGSGRVLVAGTDKGQCFLSVDPWQPALTPFGKAESHGVEALSLSRDGRILAARHRDPYQTDIWDLFSDADQPQGFLGKALTRLGLRRPPPPKPLLVGSRSDFNLGHVCTDGSRVVSWYYCHGFTISPARASEGAADFPGIYGGSYRRSFSPDCARLLAGLDVSTAGGAKVYAEGLPAWKGSAGSTWWASNDLVLVHNKLSDDGQPVSEYAYLWDPTANKLRCCLQPSGPTVSAAAADAAGRYVFFTHERASSDAKGGQSVAITQMEIATGKAITQYALADVACEGDAADQELLGQVRKTRGIRRLWVWESRGLLLGIAAPPPGDYRSTSILFALDIAAGTLRHPTSLPVVSYAIGQNDTRFVEPLGWLALASGDRARWYDVLGRRELGSVATPKRCGSDTSNCVAVSPDGGLLAVGGSSRLGAVYRTDPLEQVLIVPFDCPVDDVAFDWPNRQVKFALRRDAIVTYAIEGTGFQAQQ
ncbi:MAG TPA: TIR domain-containing protein [Planctomycetota bacterium]|nr:TIR domain-containing protein [Planctomycetota bacterium]